MNKKPTKPKRRRFSFTLRTMFLVVLAMCLLVGWKANKAHQQRKAVAWVREMGGGVQYEYEWDNENGFITGSELSVPVWLQNLIGIDFFSKVTFVAIGSIDVHDVHDVTPLARLTSLSYLELYNTPVSDLAPLAKITKLEVLPL